MLIKDFFFHSTSELKYKTSYENKVVHLGQQQ
jgi:hypothetical protein